MPNDKITIVPMIQLTERQIDQVCQLHLEAIPTLLAKLGNPFLTQYYKVALADPDVIAIAALDGSGHVLGWAIGSTNPSALTARMRTNSLWFFTNVFRSIARDPRLIFELASQLRSDPINQLSDRQIELTYIGVYPDARSKGVGATLITKFLDHARVFGAQSVVLSVEVENRSAIRFYQNHGFRSIKVFKDGRYHRERMFLLLDPQKAIP